MMSDEERRLWQENSALQLERHQLQMLISELQKGEKGMAEVLMEAGGTRRTLTDALREIARGMPERYGLTPAEYAQQILNGVRTPPAVLLAGDLYLSDEGNPT